jgi:hypothetical protein
VFSRPDDAPPSHPYPCSSHRSPPKRARRLVVGHGWDDLRPDTWPGLLYRKPELLSDVTIDGIRVSRLTLGPSHTDTALNLTGL